MKYKSISLVQLHNIKVEGTIQKLSGPAYQIKLDKHRTVTLGALRHPDNGRELRLLMTRNKDYQKAILLTPEALTAVAYLGAELAKSLDFAKLLHDIPTLAPSHGTHPSTTE